MNKPLVSLIVGMDSNRLIGSDNGLVWHLPADMAFFRRTTMGKPIIMGRKTFDSIGKALPGRQNIVVTRDRNFNPPDCETAHSIDQAIAMADDSEEIMLIGGENIYQQTIDRADIIYLTLIHHQFEGDTWFPDINPQYWELITREDFEANEKNPFSYSFIKYIKRT